MRRCDMEEGGKHGHIMGIHMGGMEDMAPIGGFGEEYPWISMDEGMEGSSCGSHGRRK